MTLPDAPPRDAGAAALARVLAGYPAWVSLAEKVALRYRGLNKIGGSVSVTALESVALDKARVRHRNGKVQLRDIESAFRETHQGAGLIETLSIVLGKPIRTNAELAASHASSREAAFATLTADLRGAQWLDADRGYLWTTWASDGAAFLAHVQTVLRAVARLPQPDMAVPLPVFATTMTGDPHAFDNDQVAGKLLERVLGLLAGGERCPRAAAHADEREGWLAASGLAPDEISSDVTALGLVGTHPVVEAAFKARSVLTYPLLTIAELGPVRGVNDVAYVVENPAVFVALVRAVAGHGPLPTIVCASGRPSLAAQRLLAVLVAHGTTLWYSGDFDPDGLSMLSALRRRHGHRLVPWRMAVDDYLTAVAALHAPHVLAAQDVDPHRLEYPALCHAMLRSGAAYQEALSIQLADDLRALPHATR